MRAYGQPDQPADRAVERLPHPFKGAWVLYAALEVTTGQVHCYYAPRCNQTQVRLQLETLWAQYQAAGKRALVVLWDNASWHTAKALRAWYYRYNQQAKRHGTIRLLLVPLPSRSPWLNPLRTDLRPGQAARGWAARHPRFL